MCRSNYRLSTVRGPEAIFPGRPSLAPPASSVAVGNVGVLANTDADVCGGIKLDAKLYGKVGDSRK